MLETQVRFLGREDPLENKMAIHSSTLAWKIPWTEEPDRLQSMGSQSRTPLSDFTQGRQVYLVDLSLMETKTLSTWKICEDWDGVSGPVRHAYTFLSMVSNTKLATVNNQINACAPYSLYLDWNRSLFFLKNSVLSSAPFVNRAVVLHWFLPPQDMFLSSGKLGRKSVLWFERRISLHCYLPLVYLFYLGRQELATLGIPWWSNGWDSIFTPEGLGSVPGWN